MAATTIIASSPQPHHQGCIGFGLDSTNKGALGFGSAATRVRWVLGQQPQGCVGLKTRPTRMFGWLLDSHKGALGYGLHHQGCIWFCSQA
ncbi:hypothetical protein Tco_1507940 [Tanacetum coccineum]